MDNGPADERDADEVVAVAEAAQPAAEDDPDRPARRARLAGPVCG